MVMRRLRAAAGSVLAAVLGCVLAVIGGADPARADEPGFSAQVGEAPGTFTVGKAPRTLTAVISTDRGLRRCLKVRWVLTVRTEGISLDQVRVRRVEDVADFRVNARIGADDARFTDVQVDPGQLCRDRTVTGRWDIAFAGPDDGSVTFRAQAVDGVGRVLATATQSGQVVSPVADRPSPEPSRTPEQPAEQDAAELIPSEEAEEPDPGAGAGSTSGARDAGALRPASNSTSVLGPGLIVGALLVFVGVGLLLRLRARLKRTAAAAEMPTGFYSMPHRGRR